MATIRYKKRFNKWYVYQLHQYWDKQLKKPRQRTTYLGVADQKGGPYTKPGRTAAKPTQTPEKAIVDFGDSYAIDQLAKAIGLEQLIADSFSHIDSLMALIAFQLCEGSAMYNCQDWLEANIAKYLFPKAQLSSQAISNLIQELGRQELQIKFFKEYIAKFFPHKVGILMDSTALPSAINASINAFGYANGSIQQKVSCLMLVDKQSKLPIYFRAIGGDIADVSTLQTTLAELKQLGLSSEQAILDAGFCSKANLTLMCQEQINFITRLPKSHRAFSDLVKEAEVIETSEHAIKYLDRVVFIQSKHVELYEQKVHAYIILDPSKKGRDTQEILKDSLAEKLSKQEQEQLDKQLKNAGFFILLSRQELAREEILPAYYMRQSIEQLFGFAKSNTNLLPLRVHSEQSIRGYLMLVFLAVIVFISMRQRVEQPMEKALLILRGLKAKIFDEQIIVQEGNKKTKEIFKALDIIMPTVMGI